MNSARQMLFFLSGAALLTASFAIVPPPAMSCGDKAACACGAACPSMGENPTPGACACAGAEKAAASADAADTANVGGCEHAAAADPAASAGLRASIDPATGELTVPASGAQAAAASAAAVPGEAAKAVEIPHPGGGVMAAVPANRTSHAVASVGEDGKAHTGCTE